MSYPDDPRAALAWWAGGGWEHGRARAPEWAAAVLAQLDAAESHVRRYGRHAPNCLPTWAVPCTCGWRTVQEALRDA